MPSIELRSKRLVFRKLTSEHISLIFDKLSDFPVIYNDFLPRSLEHVTLFTQGDLTQGIEEALKHKGSVLFAIQQSVNGSLIGYGFYNYGWDVLSIHLNIVIFPDYQRNGYGKETARYFMSYIFNNYPSNSLMAFVDEYNENGRRFAESIGFKPAGMTRREGYRDGNYYGVCAYDILKNEWSDLNGN